MALSVAEGTYTGTGAALSITGLGFLPKVVLIKSSGTPAGGDGGSWTNAAMGAGNSKSLGSNSGIQTGEFTTLDADGFTLSTGADVNLSGATYYYLALGGTDVVTGTYAGTGVAQSITGVGFQPVVVITGGTNNRFTVQRNAGHAGNNTSYFTNLADVSGAITSLDADGFTLGTQQDANANLATFYYAAIKTSAKIATGTFVGDGLDNKNITGAGFVPTNVILKNGTNVLGGVWKPTDLAGDSTIFWLNSAAAANNIQALQADGFQVGTDTRVNASGSTHTWIAFNNAVEPSNSAITTVASGSVDTAVTAQRRASTDKWLVAGLPGQVLTINIPTA